MNFLRLNKRTLLVVMMTLFFLCNSCIFNQLELSKSNKSQYNQTFTEDYLIENYNEPHSSGERLTLINGSIDFLKVDINVYIMESVNFTFYYTDLETSETISNLDNQTYISQKYNAQGEVIARSNGTLISAPDNSTILDLDTEFLSLGYYMILIYFKKEGYEQKHVIINMYVLNQPTLINDVEQLETINTTIFEGEGVNFTFTYKDKINNITLSNLNTYNYTWKQYDNQGNLISNGEGLLKLEENNTYILDFETKYKDAGKYYLQIFFSKVNYTSKSAIINLTINKRFFSYILEGNFEGNEILVQKGDYGLMLIRLIDFSNGTSLVTNASVILRIDESNYVFEEIEEGLYKYEFQTQEINTFFEEKKIRGIIIISKNGYESISFEIKIIVEMLEIFPSMPFFYFLNIIIPLILVILGLFLYKNKLKRRK